MTDSTDRQMQNKSSSQSNNPNNENNGARPNQAPNRNMNPQSNGAYNQNRPQQPMQQGRPMGQPMGQSMGRPGQPMGQPGRPGQPMGQPMGRPMGQPMGQPGHPGQALGRPVMPQGRPMGQPMGGYPMGGPGQPMGGPGQPGNNGSQIMDSLKGLMSSFSASKLGNIETRYKLNQGYSYAMRDKNGADPYDSLTSKAVLPPNYDYSSNMVQRGTLLYAFLHTNRAPLIGAIVFVVAFIFMLISGLFPCFVLYEGRLRGVGSAFLPNDDYSYISDVKNAAAVVHFIAFLFVLLFLAIMAIVVICTILYVLFLYKTREICKNTVYANQFAVVKAYARVAGIPVYSNTVNLTKEDLVRLPYFLWNLRYMPIYTDRTKNYCGDVKMIPGMNESEVDELGLLSNDKLAKIGFKVYTILSGTTTIEGQFPIFGFVLIGILDNNLSY